MTSDMMDMLAASPSSQLIGPCTNTIKKQQRSDIIGDLCSHLDYYPLCPTNSSELWKSIGCERRCETGNGTDSGPLEHNCLYARIQMQAEDFLFREYGDGSYPYFLHARNHVPYHVLTTDKSMCKILLYTSTRSNP
jgi:hypothetical protein